MYEEIKYWREREMPNCSWEPPPPRELNYYSYLKKHLDYCNYILDFGPGVGRTFNAYGDLDQLECFDITDRHLKQLKSVAADYDFEFGFTLGHEVGVTPYPDKEFDAAIACQVLLHQRPMNIVKVMSELVRIAQKVIVISWYDDSKPESATQGKWCFNHNYVKICKNNGWRMIDVDYIPEHIFFVYSDIHD